MFEICDLTLQFSTNPNKLFDSFNLKVNRNKVITLFGYNGCGKSTLLKYLVNYYKNDELISNVESNKILLGNVIGYIPQESESSILEWLSPIDNVNFITGKKLYGNSKFIRSLFNKFNYFTEEELKNTSSNLSGGKKNILTIIRELGRKPKILLIDEGFSSIDYYKRFELMNLLRDWVTQKNRTIVNISHHLDESIFFSDEIVFLHSSPTSIKYIFNVIRENQLKFTGINDPLIGKNLVLIDIK
ncbi:MAG: ATP-binding cassette domain-containing protein [Candidatus Lokiarchaeota archaeon]|nr:ATP-binding cassette domain-containing protein [Candidatus Lokiarchaeota archaeon]